MLALITRTQVRILSFPFVSYNLFIFSFMYFTSFLNKLLADAAEPWQLSFQDPATPIMQGIVDFHHDVFCFMLFILGFVM